MGSLDTILEAISFAESKSNGGANIGQVSRSIRKQNVRKARSQNRMRKCSTVEESVSKVMQSISQCNSDGIPKKFLEFNQLEERSGLKEIQERRSSCSVEEDNECPNTSEMTLIEAARLTKYWTSGSGRFFDTFYEKCAELNRSSRFKNTMKIEFRNTEKPPLFYFVPKPNHCFQSVNYSI
uniref:Uncharacterized protein n=1 Tax=Timspurckia oligopyrenoides TaxID=708627 RepID=A0A7S0ZAY9_9RHOD|mmetsp:Transcript_10693/g.19304  ORF Transcript_10693/g.19304 Transcript_10693/m.19304 type:complete len:181 (+) Transcript_10693:298-840(+)